MDAVEKLQAFSLTLSPDAPRIYPQPLQSCKEELSSHFEKLFHKFGKDLNLFHAAIFWKADDGYMRSFITKNISPERLNTVNDFSGLFFSYPKPPRSAVGHSATYKRTIMLRDLRRDDPNKIYEKLPGSQGRRDKGILCVPVLTRNSQDCLGAISITSLKPDIFTDKHCKLAEAFVEEKYSQFRATFALLKDNIAEHNEEVYNISSMVEREAAPQSEQQPTDPFREAAHKIIDELRANWRILPEQHPTKYEQVIIKLLGESSGFVSFNDLSPLFEDATNPDHARDALINRLNVKLEQHGYKLEQPRGYLLVPTSPPNKIQQT